MTRLLPTALVGVLVFSTANSALADYPIAGLKPHQRPVGAPTIEYVKREQAWFHRALTGVSKPYPRSLYFLDNQGYWHTPFNQPGMTGPYDIRGWHR